MMFNNIFFNKYTSWQELEKAIEGITVTKEKGTAFEQFVFAYFTYFKELYLISELYMGNDIPLPMKQKYKLEKRDSGVDGLFIREDGSAVAYQAKFRSAQHAPSYEELTSFWSESEHADARCIISNCYELPQQSYKKKLQFLILRNEMCNLEQDFFSWLQKYSIDQTVTPTFEKFSPKPHQNKIIDEVLAGFKNNDRGKLLAACGTGKTLTSLWIKEKLEAKTTLFIAPNLALIKQTLEEWMKQARLPFSYICVCSDDTVAKNVVAPEIDEHVIETAYIGVPVTTDSDEVLKFIYSNISKDKIIFSTYQSLDVIVAALSTVNDFSFDIAFFDEAHRTSGNKNSQLFIMGMNDTFIPCKKRLFMTATERFVSPRIIGRALQYNYTVFSMDSFEQYGPTFSSLPFREAIEQGIISDYKIVLCCMQESDLKQVIENNLIIDMGDKEVDSQNLFKQVLLAKSMNDIEVRKAISYHRDIESAQLFIKSQSGTSLDQIISGIVRDSIPSEIYVSHINGSMSAGKRKEIFDKFVSALYGVISNARCLTEGVDVPVIDAIYFADPKNSIIDIIQAVGRSLRKVKENPDKISYIIVPIIISDDITNFEDIDPVNFSTLHSVIQALRDQDRILADYIDKLNLKLAKGEKIEPSSDNESPIIIEASEKLELDDIADKILLRIAEVNKNPDNIDSTFIFTPGSRTAGVSRGSFVTIGDYNLDTYLSACVQATLAKYDSFSIGLPRDEITIDHNNVSHAVKIGALIERENKFYVTEIGKCLYDCKTFEAAIPYLQEQLLKFYKLSPITRIPMFPYRFILKLLAEVNGISKFEFAYSAFIIKDLGDRGLSDARERIFYLRKTYPNIESLNEANKQIVLTTLNEKYNTTLKIEDIWTSRTTVNNQYGYLKKHLQIMHNIINSNSLKIELTKDGAESIAELLQKTREIETCPMDALNNNFMVMRNWLL